LDIRWSASSDDVDAALKALCELLRLLPEAR
jgi:hypothetical protein